MNALTSVVRLVDAWCFVAARPYALVVRVQGPFLEFPALSGPSAALNAAT